MGPVNCDANMVREMTSKPRSSGQLNSGGAHLSTATGKLRSVTQCTGHVAVSRALEV